MLEAKNYEPCFPNYNESILGLSNSILNHYGIKPFHPTLPGADFLLGKNFPHVVVILLDGLGMNILEQNLSYRDFLRRNLYSDYSSVFPPTTTASTTTFLSGLSPIEHGWLGWDVYFEKEDKTVCCFKNTLQGTDQIAADYNVANKYLPYKNIVDLINESGKAKANIIFPFGPDGHPDFDDWINEIQKSINKEEPTFTYAYWENPDSALHELGTKSNTLSKIVREINAKMTYLCEESVDTLFLITADHGHADIRNCFLTEEYPQLANMLERPACIEPRALSFYVKKEFKDSFPSEFNKHFGQDYILFTKEEAIKKELFGPGAANPNLTGIGDYVAAAVSDKTILWNKNDKQFKSHHAGLRPEEMRIPLIWYARKNKRNLIKVLYYSFVAFFVAFILYILVI